MIAWMSAILKRTDGDIDCHCVVPENIDTSPTVFWMVFPFKPPLPSGNSSLAAYFPLKILMFETPPPQNFQELSMGWVSIFCGTTHFHNQQCKGQISLVIISHHSSH